VLVQEGKLARASFPQGGMMLFEMFLYLLKEMFECIVLVQEGKLAHTSFPHGGMMLFEMLLVLMQEGKLAHTSFPPWWNDVVQMHLRLCLCKRES
jgi:hypothetical protein